MYYMKLCAEQLFVVSMDTGLHALHMHVIPEYIQVTPVLYMYVCIFVYKFVTLL